MRASCQKRQIRLVSTLHGIVNCIKTEAIRKNVPPAYGSISPQCHPQLLSDRLENLIHNIFRNGNSSLKINVSLFGCCIGSSDSPLHPSLLLKTDYVADFKNMNEPNYKDTRITLAEAASAIFVVDFEHVLVCWDILRSNKLQNPKK